MTTPADILTSYDKSTITKTMAGICAPVDVAVYSIDNYFNMGGIIRLCHNFKVRTIYGVDCPKHYRRADMGTRKYSDIKRVTLAEFIDMMHRTNRDVVGFESPYCSFGTMDIRHTKLPPNPVLLFGSEKEGIPDELKAVCRHIISIPMFGVHNDHNVTTAAGIALYQFCVSYPEYYNTTAIDVLSRDS
jgi:tRNA G18 (ribose-2'-O)-methylase SpoU